jgi:hypothetical protein
MLISTGSPLPNWSEHEGFQFNIIGGSPIFIAAFDSPTPSEARAMSYGKIRIGLHKAGTHTFFLLTQIEGLTDGWADTPFALGLMARANYPGLRERGSGWLFTFLLVDNPTGIVRSIRAATATPQFSDSFDTLIAEQRLSLGRFTKKKHQSEISAAYKRYTDSNAMAQDALIVEDVGLSFEEMRAQQRAQQTGILS